MTEAEIKGLAAALNHPFYTAWDFWINVLIGVASIVFSVLAYFEARAAKDAARHAGRAAKMQSVAFELQEICTKLDHLEPAIRYPEARDLLSEVSRRIARSTAPFSSQPELSGPIQALQTSINEAAFALNEVRPVSQAAEDQAPQATYNAIEAHVAKINDRVAGLVGLMEMHTATLGE